MFMKMCCKTCARFVNPPEKNRRTDCRNWRSLSKNKNVWETKKNSNKKGKSHLTKMMQKRENDNVNRLWNRIHDLYLSLRVLSALPCWKISQENEFDFPGELCPEHFGIAWFIRTCRIGFHGHEHAHLKDDWLRLGVSHLDRQILKVKTIGLLLFANVDKRTSTEEMNPTVTTCWSINMPMTADCLHSLSRCQRPTLRHY